MVLVLWPSWVDPEVTLRIRMGIWTVWKCGPRLNSQGDLSVILQKAPAWKATSRNFPTVSLFTWASCPTVESGMPWALESYHAVLRRFSPCWLLLPLWTDTSVSQTGGRTRSYARAKRTITLHRMVMLLSLLETRITSLCLWIDPKYLVLTKYNLSILLQCKYIYMDTFSGQMSGLI